MITKRQYQVINSCADDWELFYLPFSLVNYGGSVYRRGDHDVKLFKWLGFEIPLSRYAHIGRWSISVSGLEIAYDIRILVGLGFLRVQRVNQDGDRTIIEPGKLTRKELSIYRDYACLTFWDHIERFGFGPHEFTITELGVTEIDKQEYREYDSELGWPEGD